MRTTEPYPPGTKKVFATLRFSGDELSPPELTDALGSQPALAYRKGEPYRTGPRTAEQIGRTGMWFFTTNGIVPAQNLAAHLRTLASLLADDPDRPARDRKLLIIRDIVSRRALRPVATCFWHGTAGAPAPTIPEGFRRLMARIDGEIHEDFAVDEGEPAHHEFVRA